MGLGTRAATKRLEVFGLNLNPFMLHKDPSHSTWPILSLTAHTLASGLLSMGIYVALSIIGSHWWQVGGMALLLSFFVILAWFHTLRWRSLMRHMKKMLILRSKVLRDGMWSEVPSRELVPGDIIQLSPGKIVPARCVVRECSEDLIVDTRSVLTDKHILTDISETLDQGVMEVGRDEELLAGSMVKSGEAYRVQVLTTGPDAFLHHAYDDGLVSNLRRTRRKDLVYSATRSLIILVALTFVIAVGAALLTAILSERQLAQVLATATFLIVFVAVHNPVGLILRYARTEGARRVAISGDKPTGAAMHTLTTVELLAAIDTLAIDVRGFLATPDVKVTKLYPMKGCTASGMLIAAALATTPESQAASAPLCPHRIAPVGDMEPINMAILEELHVHNERKFGRQIAATDGALYEAPIRNTFDHRNEDTSHSSYDRKKSKSKKSKKDLSSESTPNPQRKSNTTTTTTPTKKGEDHLDRHYGKPALKKPSEKDYAKAKKSRDGTQDTSSSTSDAAPTTTLSTIVPTITTSTAFGNTEASTSTSTCEESSEQHPLPRRKRPRTNSALRYSSHPSAIASTPHVAPKHTSLLQPQLEEDENEQSNTQATKDRRNDGLAHDHKDSNTGQDATGALPQKEDDSSVEMEDMSGNRKRRAKRAPKSGDDVSCNKFDTLLSDDHGESCDTKKRADAKRKKTKQEEAKKHTKHSAVGLEVIEPAADHMVINTLPLPLAHSSSSICAKQGSPYSKSPKVSLKGKDPCLSSSTPASRSPMELANYSRLGALFPPGCTIVHLQAHSEEGIKYARESNPVKLEALDSEPASPPPASTQPDLLLPTISPPAVSNALKQEVTIQRNVSLNKGDSHPQSESFSLPSSSQTAPPSSSSTNSTSSLTSSDIVQSDPAYSSFLVAKGDPRSVIRLCVEREDAALVNKIDALVKAQCERGHSVVAIAKGPAASLHVLERGPPNNMNLVGLICFDGVVLPDTSSTLVDAYMMGLNLKLITNDSVPTGAAFAKKIGMGSNVITIEDYLANDPHLGDGKGIDLNDADGFAEVTPENRIHLALAASGISEESFVDPSNPTGAKMKTHPRPLWGITSNDPSVLYEADVGITSRDESDVAIQSADVVLMQPGLKSLVRAIKKARQTLSVLEALAMACAVQSIRNIITLVAAWVTYGFQPIPTTSLTILVALNLPMLLIVAQFERGRATSQPPSPFIIRRVSFITFALTLFEVIAAFLMGVLVYDVKLRGLTRDQANTCAFLWFGLANGFVILLCRAPAGVFWKRPWPHPFIVLAVFASQLTATILSIFGVGMPKIGLLNAVLIWAFALIFFCIQLLVLYAARIVWKTHIATTLHSHSWFMVWHKRISQTRWYRGLLTG